MRVTTSGTTQTAFAGIQARQSAQERLQQQLASGMRVNSPGDDPLAAAQSELARSRLARLAQDQRSAQLATSVLSAADTALDSGVQVLQNVRETLVAAGNGAYNASDRQSLAAQLRAARDQLISLANTGDGAGGYVFSGQVSAGSPLSGGSAPVWNAASGQQQLGDGQFAATVDGRAAFMALPQGNGVFVTASSAGNTGTGWINPGDVTNPAQLTGHSYSITLAAGGGGALQYTVTDVTTGTTVASAVPFTPGDTITLDGQRVKIDGTPAAGDSFSVAPAGQQSIFQTLDDAISALTQSLQPGQYAEQLQRVQTTLDGALNGMTAMRSAVGTELQRVDATQTANAQEDLNLQQRRSDLRDLDFAQAISELQSNQTSMQAAMQAYASVAKTSLFQLLG